MSESCGEQEIYAMEPEPLVNVSTASKASVSKFPKLQLFVKYKHEWKLWRTRNLCYGTWAIGECFHSFKFSQTFMSVSITG